MEIFAVYRGPELDSVLIFGVLCTFSHVFSAIVCTFSGFFRLFICTFRRQEIVDPNLDARSIRFDVYMASSDFYADLEMQTSPEIYPLRSRFYISLNDADKLKKGETFKKLPKAIIIFICTNDPFHKGYAKYLSKERLFADDD